MSVFYQFFVYLILLVFVNSFLIKKNLLIDSPQIDKHKKKIFFSQNVPKSLGLIIFSKFLELITQELSFLIVILIFEEQ